MCNCNNFSGDNEFDNFVESNNLMVENESMLNFDGGGSMTDFVDDVSDAEFDNFLTKKMRERRRAMKELEEGGLSRKEARQKALEQVPRTKLKSVLAKIKAGRKVDNIDGIALGTSREAVDEISMAIQQGDNTETDLSSTSADSNDTTQAGFMSKYGMWIGIGAVVIIGGYFAYRKFAKK